MPSIDPVRRKTRYRWKINAEYFVMLGWGGGGSKAKGMGTCIDGGEDDW